MANIVREVDTDQRSSKTPQGQQYTHIFQVILDTVGANPARSARLADGVPDIGDQHPIDTSAYVLGVDVHPTESRLIWNVHVKYQTTHFIYPTPKPNPTDEAPSIRWGAWSRTIAIDKNKDGDAILNAAEDPFDPPIEGEEYHLELTVVRNEAAHNPLTAAGYYGAVNNATATICGLEVTTRKAKCVQWSGDSAERNGYSYYVVTYKIRFNLNTWDKKILEQGMNYKDGSKKKHIVGDDNEPVDSPQLLTAAGAVLALGGTPVFKTSRVAPEKNFSTLNLNI